MRVENILLVCCGLALPLAAVADEPRKEPKDAAVRTIDLTGFRGEARGNVKKPTAITNAEELAKAFPDKDWQERLKKQVDFGKEQLLFFAWSGSGGDKLSHTAEKGEKGPVVVFHYQAGLTDDLRRHFHLYALPKGATWRVEDKK